MPSAVTGTLASNGDGCDHGWGGHHLVAGDAVRGREIDGSMAAKCMPASSAKQRSALSRATAVLACVH